MRPSGPLCLAAVMLASACSRAPSGGGGERGSGPSTTFDETGVVDIALIGTTTLAGATELAVLAGMAVVFLFFARRSLRYLERRAKEDGKLIVRWQ